MRTANSCPRHGYRYRCRHRCCFNRPWTVGAAENPDRVTILRPNGDKGAYRVAIFY